MMSNKKQERFVLLYDREKVSELFFGIKLLNNPRVVDESVDNEESVDTKPTPSVEATSSSRSCSTCQAQFDSVEDQRQHFKLDWHRYNLKQSLNNRAVISEESFEKMLHDIENDEENEISASDSEDDDEESEESDARTNNHIRGTKIQFVSGADTVLSLNKCLVLDPGSRDAPSDSDLVTLLENVPRRLTWAVLMLGGGHFAGEKLSFKIN